MLGVKETATFHVSFEPSQGLLVSMALRYDQAFALEIPEAFGLGQSWGSAKLGRRVWRYSVISLLRETYALLLALEGKHEGPGGIYLPSRIKVSSTRLVCSYWRMRGHELSEICPPRFMEEIIGKGHWSPSREQEYAFLVPSKEPAPDLDG